MAGNQNQTEVDVPALQAALAQAQAECEQQAQEIASLKRSLAAQKGVATRAKNEAAAIEAEMHKGDPRVFGPIDKPLAAGELKELLDGADDVELAFVGRDGVEIGGLAPRTITGHPWQVQGGRLALKVPDLTVHGPRPGEAPFQLAAYALTIDGEPVAFVPRHEVLPIGPGATFQLKDDVGF